MEKIAVGVMEEIAAGAMGKIAAEVGDGMKGNRKERGGERGERTDNFTDSTGKRQR